MYEFNNRFLLDHFEPGVPLITETHLRLQSLVSKPKQLEFALHPEAYKAMKMDKPSNSTGGTKPVRSLLLKNEAPLCGIHRLLKIQHV